MDRALLLSDGGDIEPEHLPMETIKASEMDGSDTVPVDDIADDPSASQWTPVERAERAQIIEALRLEGGNQSRAARRLGIARSTMVLRIEAFKLPRPNKR